MSILRYDFKISEIVRANGILIDRRRLKRNRIVTEELDYICHQLENSHRTFWWRLAQQRGVSVGSSWTATNVLQVRPYNVTVLPRIKSMDYGKD
jgi:hypothetical protein